MNKQTTLKQEASCSGVGLHSGRKVNLSLKPASAGRGIVFRRLDAGGYEIPASVQYLSHINHATCLSSGGVRIETIEHLLAALHALGVDNVIVELDGPEVPIMDGSATPFIYLIQETGIRMLSAPRSYLTLTRPVSVGDNGRFVAAYPCDRLRLTYTINFDHPLLKHQEYSLEIDESSFVADIAPARTFGFLRDVELMRQSGLALGGSLDNAVVLGETCVLNNPLRFPDEFVRHKILDLVGDLVLLGRPLRAHVVAMRAGHGLHTRLVKAILEAAKTWDAEPALAPIGAVAGAEVAVPAFARRSY
ncbi:MAG TPA: UDP-3-O-acyl-N-acetylglucosamine deacetylase [Vicinamibacteria bacterium]